MCDVDGVRLGRYRANHGMDNADGFVGDTEVAEKRDGVVSKGHNAHHPTELVAAALHCQPTYEGLLRAAEFHRPSGSGTDGVHERGPGRGVFQCS